MASFFPSTLDIVPLAPEVELTADELDRQGMMIEASDEMLSFHPTPSSDLMGAGPADGAFFSSPLSTLSTDSPKPAVPPTSALMYSVAVPMEHSDGSATVYVIGGMKAPESDVPNSTLILQYKITPRKEVVGPDPVFVKNKEVLPEALIQHTAVAVGKDIYIIGNACTREGTIYKLDTEELTVELIAVKDPHRSANLPPNPVPNAYHGHTSVLMKKGREDIIVSFGGCEYSQTLNRTFHFNIQQKTWMTDQTLTPQRPFARLYHVATASECGRFMYVFGGAPDAKTTTDEDIVFGDFWRYEILTKKWKRLDVAEGGIVPAPRGSCSLLTHGKFMYLYGGFDGKDDLTTFYRYDVEANSWTTPALLDEDDLSAGRWALSSCRVDDVFYYFGGFGKRENPKAPLNSAKLCSTVQAYRPEPSSLKQLMARFLARNGIGL